MIIEVDHIIDQHGNTLGVVTLDSSLPATQQTIASLANGTLDLVKSGWGQMSNHPNYPGHTLLQVLQAEGKRLNDANVVAPFKL